MKRLSLAVLVACICALGAPSAYARDCEGVQAPDSVTVDGQRLQLNGLGVREATAFQVNVYVAGLYVEHTSRDGNQLINAEERKRLVLNFVREVERADIVEAMTDGFRRNAGGQSSALTPRLQQLNGYMANMAEGQNMTFTYVPGTGLEVSVQGQRRGVIEGADFARVFFSIWLGSNPPNPGLRTGLLGGTCG